VVNIFSWLYLIRIALPQTFIKSEEFYLENENFARLEQLRLVFKWYLCGKWQWARFGVGGAIVALMNWLSFNYRAGVTHFQVLGYSIELELTISLTILCFVAVMEFWIWYMRLRVTAKRQILDDMHKVYRFSPI
jgi:hypothetical protein